MAANLTLPDAGEFAFEDIPPAIAQLAGLQTALSARLIIERQDPVPEEEDVILDVEETAALLKISKQWLYMKSKNLPFTRRIGNRLRFSKRGALAYRDKRR